MNYRSGFYYLNLFAIAAFQLVNAPGALGQPYSLPDTEVIPFHSDINGIDYEIYLALPANYEASKKSYPLILTLDADYAFAITRNTAEHFTQRRNLPEVVIASIAYPGAAKDQSIYRRNRSRDYTPTHHPSEAYNAEFSKQSGGADKFLEMIERELLPTLKQRVRLQDDTTIVGHSFGGLFASYALVTRPYLFNRYLIVSPSLWYDSKVLFDRLPGRLQQDKKGLRVFLSVGSHENQPYNNRAMVDDLIMFEEKLKPFSDHIQVELQVFQGETHNSVFPGAVSRGLRVLF